MPHGLLPLKSEKRLCDVDAEIATGSKIQSRFTSFVLRTFFVEAHRSRAVRSLITNGITCDSPAIQFERWAVEAKQSPQG